MENLKLAAKIKGAKLFMVGNSYHIRVPKDFVTHELLDKEKTYDIQILEKEENPPQDQAKNSPPNQSPVVYGSNVISSISDLLGNFKGVGIHGIHGIHET